MNHEYYMQQALDLAKKGWPGVAPNPMVGCVIVKNNEIVSSAYHEKFGEAHAEVLAIQRLPATASPAECTLYVTLEPCSHFGKTPPCADLIINKRFKRVVVAGKDPNPLVSGQGIKKLREAGIEVITGVLKEESQKLNKRFNTFFREKRPYLILKWAQTADGYISRAPVPKNKAENSITRKEAQQRVHSLRAEMMGIFVGKNTVLKDNPRLTTRLVEGKNPLRIFIDRKLEVPLDHHVYDDEAPTLVFNEQKEEQAGTNTWTKIDFEKPVMDQVLQKLHALQIQSVLVEGGAFLINDLVQKNLWDEVLVFQNPALYFKEGLKAPVFALKNTFELVGDDKLFHHFKNETMPVDSVLEKEVF